MTLVSGLAVQLRLTLDPSVAVRSVGALRTSAAKLLVGLALAATKVAVEAIVTTTIVIDSAVPPSGAGRSRRVTRP